MNLPHARRAVLFACALFAACETAPHRRPVVVIGWDGADWQLLDELMANDKMPELAALLREGTSGVLHTIQPPLSPIVWTTMMTGRSPLDHRVLDFTRFDPATRVRESIESGDRQVPAVWTIASSAGRTVGVFGMWATYPAERVNGVIVSDRLMSLQNGAHPEASRVVFPEDREAWAREALARAERFVGDAELRSYVGEIARDARLDEGLRRVLVETEVYDDLAVSFFRDHHPDLTILYVQGTDAIGHLFAPYRAPRMKGVRDEDVARWGGVADRYYAEADRRLGVWRAVAREAGAAIVLVSDHGFFWGEGRPASAASAAAATAGRWHRDEGIYVVAGPGIHAAAPKSGRGEAAQVAPTLLALLGIAPDSAMPAPFPGVAAAAEPPRDYAASYQSERMPVASAGAPPVDEAVANLRALGYIGGAEPDRAPAALGSSTRTAGSFGNEGLILLAAGRVPEAKTAFLHALDVDPHHAASLWNLAQLLATDDASAVDAEATLMRAVAAGSQDAARRVFVRAHERMQAGNCRGALDDVREVAKANPSSAVAPAAEGLALLCLGDREGAAGALRRSLAIDPDQPEVTRALASLR